MAIAIGLVTLIVFLFLRDIRATLIPAIAVPLSIVGTFGAMYLLGFSLNILSLMALTIATGFVVDDAIVVLENITRYVEAGMGPRRGCPARRPRGRLHRDVDQHLADRRFHPDSFHGRHSRPAVPRIRRDALFRHLSSRSLLSLTLTPMMCALFLRRGRAAQAKRRGAASTRSQRSFAAMSARSAGRCATAAS